MADKTMANRYPGECTRCGETIEPGAGIARGVYAGRGRNNRPRYTWTVEHRPAEWVGSPTSGAWFAGCPSEGHPQPAVVPVDTTSTRRSSPYRGGRKGYTVRTSSGWTGTRNYRGRCEDAPCCGCCTF